MQEFVWQSPSEGGIQPRWKCSFCSVPQLAPWTVPTELFSYCAEICLSVTFPLSLNFASWSHSAQVCSAFHETVLKDWLLQGVLLSHLLFSPRADSCSQTFEVRVLLVCFLPQLLPGPSVIQMRWRKLETQFLLTSQENGLQEGLLRTFTESWLCFSNPANSKEDISA